MKRLKVWIMGAVLAAALTGCSEERDLSGIQLEDIQEVNEGAKLLDNHDTVSYKMEMRDENGKMTEEAMLGKDGDDTLYQMKVSESSTVYRQEVMKDGWLYSQMVDGDDISYEVCLFVDDEFDENLKEYVRAFLVSDVDGLDITQREDAEEYYSITAQVDEGDNVSEEYDYFYEYIMNKESLEIDQFVAYALDADKKQDVISFAQVMYDEEYSEPSFVNELEKPDKTRTVTLVADPGTSEEKKTTHKIAKNALFDVIVPEEYGVYTDSQGTKEYDVSEVEPEEDGNYEDITLYFIK